MKRIARVFEETNEQPRKSVRVHVQRDTTNVWLGVIDENPPEPHEDSDDPPFLFSVGFSLSPDGYVVSIMYRSDDNWMQSEVLPFSCPNRKEPKPND